MGSRILIVSELFKDVPFQTSLPSGIDSHETVTGITQDSRSVLPGTIFVAVKGTQFDGHDFIEQAFKSGALLIVGERPIQNTRYLQVSDAALMLAWLAHRFYGEPSRDLLMVGVTGTSGKTTTTYILESILKAAGKNPGVLGTVNFRFGEKILASTHTTPGPIELQALLREMRDSGCRAVVMEVSSHALAQKRTAFIAFDGMLFTNLSAEHLDFHPDMDDYYAAKRLLFTEYVKRSREDGKKPQAVALSHTTYGKRLIAETPDVIAASVDEVRDLNLGTEGIEGVYRGVRIQSHLAGSFNVSNIVGAIRLAQALEISNAAIEQGIAHLKSVPGRLEAVVAAAEQGIHVFVDYAHKPDALEKVLQALRVIQPKGQGRIMTIFGCGGDRDRTKRPVMGRIAEEYSDGVYVTSDNPRTENPDEIIREILAGMKQSHCIVEPDRRRAITQAVVDSKEGDILLIAGKGHEDYQIIGKQKIHFDDREVANEALEIRRHKRGSAH